MSWRLQSAVISLSTELFKASSSLQGVQHLDQEQRDVCSIVLAWCAKWVLLFFFF